jgi:PAS domain S-box-containing protein
MPEKPTPQQLAAENADLRARLEKAEETLREIFSGEADALMVPSVGGAQLFTLKGADQVYRTLIEEMNEGALTLTAEGVILYANHRLAEMLKTPLEKVIGGSIHTWIASDRQSILQSLLSKSGETQRREELVLTASDGTRVPVYISVNRMVRDEAHDFFCLVATDLTEQKRNEAIAASEKLAQELLAASNQTRRALLSVIEDQKKAEDDLRGSEERFRSITASAQDAILMMDSEGKIAYWNAAAEKMFGYTEREAIGQTLHALLAPQRFHADISKGFSNFLETGAGPIVGKMTELAALKKDGTEIPIELSLSAIKRDGQWNGIGIVRDISERKRAEQLIQEEKAFSDSLILSLPDIFYLIDQQGTMLRWSKKGLELFGLSPEEISKTNVLALVYEEDRPLITQKIRQAFETGSAEVEARLSMKDGVHNYVLSATRIETQHGLNVIGVGVDITARKQAEEQIRLSQITYEGIINSITETIYIQDENGVFLNVSLPAEKMYGYPCEYFVGRTLEFISAPGKNDLAEIAKRVRQAFSGKRQTIEFWGLKKDGTVFPKEVSLVPGTYFGGKVVIAVARDITERKVAEEQLFLSSHLLDSSADSIMAFDFDGNFIYLNEAAWETRGYTRDEMMAMNLHGLDVPEYDKFVEAKFAELMERGEITFEAAHRCKDGSIMPVEVSSRLVESGGRKLILSASRDITARKKAESELARLNRTLKTLSAGNLALVRATSEDELLCTVMDIIVDKGGYSMAAVCYANDDSEQGLTPMAWSGMQDSYCSGQRISWADTEQGQLPISKAIRSGIAQICHDITGDPVFEPWRDDMLARGYKANIALPLTGGGRTFGGLNIYSSAAEAFNKEEVKLLEELANDLAYGVITLRTRAAHEQHEVILRESLEQSIQTIASTVEARDPYTAGHQRRVGELATAIALEIGLPEDQVKGIHLAAIIHDLGKIHIPAEILAKPGKLNDIEYMLIKMHPQAGYNILKGVKFPWPIADIVLQHHEKLDGSGYPQGLNGEQILLESRIMTVADVVEAMSSHRPYRAELGIEAALNEIQRGRGTSFDPAVVDACMLLFAEKGFKFSR